jgi:hypothetical protein
LGVILLIFGALHIPLPQADFHNIRHHDEPGEICVYHDHLLRWHPSADRDENIAIFHWHWFLPGGDSGDGTLADHDDQHQPSSLPSLHAHFGDWSTPDWPTDPVLEPDAHGRLLERLTLAGMAVELHHFRNLPDSSLSGSSSRPRASGEATPLGRHARSVLHQRWNC